MAGILYSSSASVSANGPQEKIVKKASPLVTLALGAFFVCPLGVANAQTPTVRPELVASYPHDPGAFTQGLLVHEGKLYESTGLLGRSSLRRVVTKTGVVEKSIDLAPNVFAEGLALVGDRFFQLTWQNHVAFTYDLDFVQNGRIDYSGEGWGLCYDGQRLVMSDGSSRLFFRNPTTFAVTGDIEVRNENGPIANLNELECVGSLVYANVWQTNTILRIDPASGDVLHTIDASGLLTQAEAANVDVLNGIAFDPATSHFYVTGKLWPKLFEVRFAFDPGTKTGTGGTGGSGAATGTGGSAGSTSGTGGAGESGGSSDTESPPAKPARSRGCGCTLLGSSDEWPLGAVLLSLVALVRRSVRGTGRSSPRRSNEAREGS
jgi:glutamine cyclotransferase